MLNKYLMDDDSGDERKHLGELKSLDGDIDDDELSELYQAKMINSQFDQLFDYDPAMRRLISEEEASKMSLEEKYHIISAYMRGGGI